MLASVDCYNSEGVLQGTCEHRYFDELGSRADHEEERLHSRIALDRDYGTVIQAPTIGCR